MTYGTETGVDEGRRAPTQGPAPGSTRASAGSGRRGLRQKRERFHMDGANNREVQPIVRGDAMDAEALGDGGDRRVGTAEAKVGIALGEVGHTSDVSVSQLGQAQATRPEVAQEPDLGVGATPLAEEVTHLGGHGGWDQSRFDEGLKQARCAVVWLVPAVLAAATSRLVSRRITRGRSPAGGSRRSGWRGRRDPRALSR
jgi:hypothetical protein